MEEENITKTQRKKIKNKGGFSHRGFLGKLALQYPFDLVKDVPPDMMHLAMNLIKGVARMSQNLF